MEGNEGQKFKFKYESSIFTLFSIYVNEHKATKVLHGSIKQNRYRRIASEWSKLLGGGETSQVLLVGVPGVFSQSSPFFAHLLIGLFHMS